MHKQNSKPKFDVHRTLPTPNRHKSLPTDGSPDKIAQPAVSRWQRVALIFAAVVLSSLIFIASWDGINISRASRQLFGDGNILSLIFSKQLKGSERGRVNVLLVGYSKDDPGHPGAKLTDSIILLSLSTTTTTGYMLSVPRDLYVNIPDSGYAKINEAYQDGGMGSLRQIVSRDFKVPIDYYLLINYTAVRETVNALNGISLKVKSQDKRGLYDPNISKVDGGPLKLSNGWHQLDGQTALNYTRARGDYYRAYGFAAADFDRTQHQRQVLAAIKNKINWKLVLDPLNNGQLFQAIAKNIKTNLKSGEARPLFGLFNGVRESDLKSISLNNVKGQNLLASYAAPGGLSALIPAAGLNNYSQIQFAIERLNASTSATKN